MPSFLDRPRWGDRAVWIAIALWVLTMIATPIVRWTAGDGTLGLMISLGVLTQVGSVATVLVRAWGPRPALRLGLLVLAAAWLAEFLGSRTGFPFGRYAYAAGLQPQLGGVPLLVPFAWMMMLPPAWAAADTILRSWRSPPGFPGRLARAALAALAFTAWDLSLDPLMAAWGFWRWPEGGLYFGIPLTNYLGWLLVSFLIALFLAPARLPLQPLLVIYGAMWFLQSFGLAFFWGLPGPALCGFLAMGAILAWAWMRSRS